MPLRPQGVSRHCCRTLVVYFLVMPGKSVRQLTRWTPETAAQAMREAGLTPLMPYPGRTTEPWQCRRVTCGAEVAPNLNNIRRGISRGCRYCAACADKEAGAGHTRWTHESASAVMRTAGLEPLDRYPGSGDPWRCLCVKCGQEVTPRFAMVRRGASKGCKYCSGRAEIEAEVAVAGMREADLEPLEPYPGHTASRWRCRCTRCGWIPGAIQMPQVRFRSQRGCAPRRRRAGRRGHGGRRPATPEGLPRHQPSMALPLHPMRPRSPATAKPRPQPGKRLSVLRVCGHSLEVAA